MSPDSQTPGQSDVFDFDAFPSDTCFHDRREGGERRGQSAESGRPPAQERRARPERRRRIDPTTFEREYTAEELEFMSAMQWYKSQTGKQFPSYGEVLKVARSLGYAKLEQPSEGASPDA